MNKLLLSTLILAFMAMAPQANAQKFADMDKSPMDVAMYRNQEKMPVVRVIYSRPQKNDREIFKEVIKNGEVWRTGANESTEITLYKDMMIGDKKVEAGTYTLFTIPGEKEWTVILNKDINTWGSYGYKQERDIVRVMTPARKAPTTIEAFSIVFEPKPDGTDMLMGWDDTYVKVPFKEVM